MFKKYRVEYIAEYDFWQVQKRVGFLWCGLKDFNTKEYALEYLERLKNSNREVYY